MSASYKRLRDCVISPDSTQRDLVELDWLTHIERLLNSTYEMTVVRDSFNAVLLCFLNC